MVGRVVDLDGLTADSVRDGGFEGRSITVLGLARSGVAMARFFADLGAHVTVYDGRSAAELEAAIESLGDRNIELALGPQVEPATAWAGADLVATSPSINPDFPARRSGLRVRKARRRPRLWRPRCWPRTRSIRQFWVGTSASR